MNAAEITQRAWDERRADLLAWLRDRGFSEKGAQRAAQSFIETMVFVAKETGEPQCPVPPQR